MCVYIIVYWNNCLHNTAYNSQPTYATNPSHLNTSATPQLPSRSWRSRLHKSCLLLEWPSSWDWTRIASRQRLRSSSRHHLVVPRHRRSTLSCRAFSVDGPMAWNAMPDDLRDPSLSADNFRKKLKTYPETAEGAEKWGVLSHPLLSPPLPFSRLPPLPSLPLPSPSLPYPASSPPFRSRSL